MDIGFLFASPLVIRDGAGLKALDPLNFMREAKAIKESIKKTEKAAKFLSMVATEENFEKMLRKEPQVLHISCHGIHNSPQTMGQFHA